MYLNMPWKTDMFEIPIFLFSTYVLSVLKTEHVITNQHPQPFFLQGKIYGRFVVPSKHTAKMYSASVDDTIVKPQIDKNRCRK